MTTRMILDLDSERESNEHNSRRNRWIHVFIAFLFVGMIVRLSPWMTWESTLDENGQEVSIRRYWSRCTDYAYGKPPNWQRQTHEDGTVLEGPLKNGLRHGTWRQVDSATTLKVTFKMGNKIKQTEED